MNWKLLPSNEQLQAEYQADVEAGKTKLTYNEWCARRIMTEARDHAAKKTKAVNKRPVDNVSHETIVDPAHVENDTQPVEKIIHRAKASKKSKPPAHKAKKGKRAGEKVLPTPGTSGPPEQWLKAEAPVDKSSAEPDDRVKLESGLTAKQEMFCRHYIACDYNATKAAKETGYSEKTARSQGQRLLTKDDIQRFIAELQKPKLKALDISADWIIQEYAKMARANLGHFLRRNQDGTIHTVDGLPSYDFSGVTDDQLVGLAGLEVVILPSLGEDEPNPLKVKVKIGDKKAALDVLAKRAGLLKEHIEHSGEVKVTGSDTKDLAMRVAFLLRQAAARDKKES